MIDAIPIQPPMISGNLAAPTIFLAGCEAFATMGDISKFVMVEDVTMVRDGTPMAVRRIAAHVVVTDTVLDELAEWISSMRKQKRELHAKTQTK